jgi:hypothetical protein
MFEIAKKKMRGIAGTCVENITINFISCCSNRKIFKKFGVTCSGHVLRTSVTESSIRFTLFATSVISEDQPNLRAKFYSSERFISVRMVRCLDGQVKFVRKHETPFQN